MIWFATLLVLQFASAEVTEKEIVTHVLNKFPAVQMAQEDLKISKAEVTFAEGAFDMFLQGKYTDLTGNYEYNFLQTRLVKPTSIFGLELFGGFRQSDGNIPVYNGDMETLTDGEWTVGAKIPLLRGFWVDERRANLQKNKLVAEQRQYQLQTTELEQVRNSLHRYWDWRLSLQRLSIHKNLLQIALLRDEWLAKRTKAGDIAKFERDDNRRTILQRQSNLLQAEQNFRQALSEMEFYIDDADLLRRLESPALTKSEFPVPLVANSELQKPDALIEKALKTRPEFKSLLSQKGQLEVDEELQSNRFLPQLDLEAQHSKDRGIRSNTIGSNSLGDDNTKISLQLEIPIQYRRIRGRAGQIEGSLARLNHQNRMLAQRVRADIVITQKNLSVSLQRRELAVEELTLAQRLETGERTRLRQGETNILTVNLREQATAEAEFRLAEASAEALKHFISLKTTLGEVPTAR